MFFHFQGSFLLAAFLNFWKVTTSWVRVRYLEEMTVIIQPKFYLLFVLWVFSHSMMFRPSYRYHSVWISDLNFFGQLLSRWHGFCLLFKDIVENIFWKLWLNIVFYFYLFVESLEKRYYLCTRVLGKWHYLWKWCTIKVKNSHPEIVLQFMVVILTDFLFIPLVHKI